MRKGTSSVICRVASIFNQVLIQRLVKELVATLTCRSFIVGHPTRRMRGIGLCECDASKQVESVNLTSAARWILPDVVDLGLQTLNIVVSRARWTINNLQL